MKPWCLPPAEAEKFKRALIDGEIDPVKLAAMSSPERRNFFANRFGEDLATEMNRALEEKLLLKNQQAGMVAWAKKMMAHDQPAQRDLVARIQDMKTLLTPTEENGFLEDMVAHKLGTRVTKEEAQAIADLSAKAEETKVAMEDGSGDRMDYGRAVVDLRKYVGELTHQAQRIKWVDLKSSPLSTIGKASMILADTAKSINASMDNSALLRQGLKVLFSHPSVWAKNARQSFVDLVHAFGSDRVMDEVNADIISRPNYNLMSRAKLAVGIDEEMFPSSLPERIPVVGRAYRASEHAFAAFQRRTRADVFDKYVNVWENAGIPLDAEELQNMGRLVNSLTGRGDLGSLEKASGPLNVLFFAPRMVKAHLDTLLLHPLGAGVGGMAQKQAAINLLKWIAGVGVILAVARAVKQDSVEWDMTSADAGKIKVGNTRFDVTGGVSSIVTLAARMITGSSKSSTTQKVTDLTKGRYSRQDVLMNYVENKLSPAASVARDLLRNKTFGGDKPTFKNEVENLALPIPVKTYLELKNDPNSANIIAALIADALGVSTNTYGKK